MFAGNGKNKTHRISPQGKGSTNAAFAFEKVHGETGGNMAHSFHGPHDPTNQHAISIENVNATPIPNPAMANPGDADEAKFKKQEQEICDSLCRNLCKVFQNKKHCLE